MTWTLYEGDCLDVMRGMDAESVHLVFADPPYNIGKAEWDKIDNYLEWCEEWIAEASRVLKPNGAFWVSHSEPDVLVDISRLIERHGRKRINWITWDKYNGASSKWKPFLDGYTLPAALRCFQQNAEYLIYHAADPMPIYLREYRERAGLTRNQVDIACGNIRKKGLYAGRGTDLCYRWEAGDCLPSKQQYEQLMRVLGGNKSYGDYQREFKSLRYTFNNPGKVSSVWQFDPAPRNGHPTPKPVPLLERIIQTCTNPGDIVLDPFAGSGTTLEAAVRLGRKAIGIERDPKYCEIIKERLVTVDAQQRLF